MKVLVICVLSLSSLFSECGDKPDLFFLQLEQNLEEIQNINKEIQTNPSGSDKRLVLILRKEKVIETVQGELYTNILQRKITSDDPRACDKLLVFKKLLESLNRIKMNIDNKWIEEFENELASLKLLLNPGGVSPKEKKRPRKYTVENYL